MQNQVHTLGRRQSKMLILAMKIKKLLETGFLFAICRHFDPHSSILRAFLIVPYPVWTRFPHTAELQKAMQSYANLVRSVVAQWSSFRLK